LRAIFPANGPEYGGTIIDITMEEVPLLNDLEPDTKCNFPGNVSVECIYVNTTNCLCETPPLVQGIDDVIDFGHVSYSWAKVRVTLEQRDIGIFYWLYTRDVKVTNYEPLNMVANSTSIDTEIVVYGTAFLGHRNESEAWKTDPVLANIETSLRCRFNVSETDSTVVVGRYYSNHSVACIVPGSVFAARWAARPSGAI
jgi:hypothetical protein